MKTIIMVFCTFILLLRSDAWALNSKENQDFDILDINFNKTLNNIEIIPDPHFKNVDQNLATFIALNNAFEEFKLHNLSFGTILLNKVEKGDPLSGDELYFLKRTVATYNRMNSKMLELANMYRVNGLRRLNYIKDTKRNIPFATAELIYIAGNIQVLDNITKVHHIYYEQNGIFRRILKKTLKDRTDDGEKLLKEIRQTTDSAIETGNSMSFKSEIILVDRTEQMLLNTYNENSNVLKVISIINTNEASELIRRGETNFKAQYHFFIDVIVNTGNFITNWLSSVFGNISGSISWRKGYFYLNDEVITKMKNELRPLDIMLEKSPFVLTDEFIPGHYGHVAIYLGTKEQLIELGMWNHPDIVPYQSDIEAGKVVLEAVRPGVRLSTLETFSNIDEVNIIRKKDAYENPRIIFESITRGMDQIGKDYDFNFDVDTLDKIVCSELIYIVFGNVHWPTKYRFGRSTISPDDVAEILFLKDTKFNVQQNLVSYEKGKIQNGSLTDLGAEIGYELRNLEGEPLESPDQADAIFWKKSEKCYLTLGSTSEQSTRLCKTSYTLQYYEENTSEN